MMDPDVKTHCDVLLFKIDVRAGTWGIYNFYKMQVVHQKGKDLYILFTRWGRIGDDGQFQQTPFPRCDEAIKEFRKIFKSKTGNDWLQLPTKPFERKPKKYRLVEPEERVFGKDLKDMKLDFPRPKHTSQLNPYVQDLMKELTDVSAMWNAMKQVCSSPMLPFGRLNKQKLIEAKGIIAQLQAIVKELEEMKKAMPLTDMEKYAAGLEKVAHLSNEYYHLIPPSGYEFERIPILDDEEKLMEEWKSIETLLELEVAAKMMAGALHRINELNPLDYVYRCMGCKIQLMDETDVEAQYILRYVSTTAPQSKVQAIFRLSREGEAERLKASGIGSNHRLLLHGSSSSNLISILSRGLLVAPPEAPCTGYLFGKGIYTADKFSKSRNYCHNYSTNSKTKFMLVCQVALGKCKDVYLADEVQSCPDGYDSVRAIASKYPDPAYDLTLPTGVVMPLGSEVSRQEKKTGPRQWRNWVSDHEFIVYKSDQVALRYLIQFQ